MSKQQYSFVINLISCNKLYALCIIYVGRFRVSVKWFIFDKQPELKVLENRKSGTEIKNLYQSHMTFCMKMEYKYH